jgi:hypothetical protein
MKKLLLATVLATGLAVTSAHATFVQADVADTKIFFNNDATNGHDFTGNVEVNNTGPLVNFHGEDAVDPKNGFATIKPLEMDGNGNFVSLRIVPTENTWSAFTFRGQLEPISFGGEVDLSVVNQFGVTQNFSFTGLAGPDTDFGDIGIKSIDNQRIASITLTAPDGEAFKELKQFEVLRTAVEPECTEPTGCVITPVTSTPEPTSLAVLGVGLVGLGMVRRRRQ